MGMVWIGATSISEILAAVINSTMQLIQHFPPFLLQQSKNEPGSHVQLRDQGSGAQRDPGRDLFLWAVVQNNRELAEIAWEQVMKTLWTFPNKIWGKNEFLSLSASVSVLHVSVQCRDCMSAALAASKILKKMAAEGKDADEAQDMRDLADHYENQAIGRRPQP